MKSTRRESDLLIYLLILGLLMFLIWATDRGIRKLSEENEVAELTAKNQETVERINTMFFYKMKSMAKILSEDPIIGKFCSTPPNETPATVHSILATAKRLSGSSLCYIIDAKGVVLESTLYDKDPSLIIVGQDYSFRPYFQNAVMGHLTIYPALGTTTGERGIYFSSPVYSDGNTVAGVVVFKVGMEMIDSILSGLNAKSFITTREGVVFASTEPDWLYRYSMPLSSNRLKMIKDSMQFGNTDLKPMDFMLDDNNRKKVPGREYLVKNHIGETGWNIVQIKGLSGGYHLSPLQKSFILQSATAMFTLSALLLALYISARQRRKTEEKLLILTKVVEQSPATVVITDTEGTIEYVNPRFFQLTGYTKNEVLGRNPSILKSGEHTSEFYKNLWESIKSGHLWKGEFCNLKKNGDKYWEASTISPIFNTQNFITHFVALKEDITDRKKMQEKLNFYATTDAMTGTLNRRTCMSLLEELMEESNQKQENFVICFVDINGLKTVNDTFGHSSGDDLILSFADCLKRNIRETDRVCRLGGDEFLILFPRCTLPHAMEIWDRIKKEMDEINEQNRKPFLLSCGHGLAEYSPGSGVSVDELIQSADQVMYRNKKAVKELLGSTGVLRL